MSLLMLAFKTSDSTQHVVPKQKALYIRAFPVQAHNTQFPPPHSLQGTYSVLSLSPPRFRKSTNEEISISVTELKRQAEICSYDRNLEN